MNKNIVTVLAFGLFLLPTVSHAQALTDDQIRSEIAILQAEITDLINQIAAMQAAHTTVDTSQPAPAFGSTTFNFNVTPTVGNGEVTLTTDTPINQAHLCLSKDGGAQDCSYWNKPTTIGPNSSTFVFQPEAGSYTFTLKGIKYGASGVYNGAANPGDSQSATVTGSFVVPK